MPEHDDASERELQDAIAHARAGDVAAFNTLVERFQQAAYRVALRMLGDGDAAADATQEAFIAAYRAIGRFRGGSFRVWLLRIVTNHCLDVWRARKRRPVASLDTLLAPGDDDTGPDAELSAALVDRAWDPVELAERRELREFMQQALLALPEEQRIIVILCDVEGMSYEEIALITGVNLGTVKSRLARGRARLRGLLLRHPELLPASFRHTPKTGQPSPPQHPRNVP
jgi:RNA polymerase sigma factor (sigma-70 family)